MSKRKYTKPQRKNANVISRVRKYFPDVEEVEDATESVLLTVKKEDSIKGRRKDPKQCALARACCRMKGVTGAIINIGYSYLVYGPKAIRYKTSVSVGREITSFDRHHDFSAGTNYRLSKVSPRQRLGRQHNYDSGPHETKKNPPQVHRTNRIRVSKAE